MKPSAPVRTTCPYCGVGCGVLATPREDGSVAIAGDPEHPANFGRLCSKGLALGETLSLDGRLLHPKVNGRREAWEVALDLVARRFSQAIRDHGPDSVAFYVSGQLLTEDYYVANKLMKGFIGSANIDTNSRLCMASSVAGHRRAFGSDTVPGCYEDLEQADLVVLVGSNLAWCHPVLFQRLLAAREKRGTRIVVIDPRRSATAEQADVHLALNADSDIALFEGLFLWLRDRQAFDPRFSKHISGLAGHLAGQVPNIAAVAAETGVSGAELEAFYEDFYRTERVVTIYSQGVNQSACGTDKVNAILNVHLATGRIGRPGLGPFSVTGQPNAMGGREVGGLANMLAAHMAIEDAEARDRVQRFWKSPAMAARPGLKAVDLFGAVSTGKIKALWIMGTNPAVSVPEADRVAGALDRCPFVVVSDVIADTETARRAHVLLPAAAWGEKDGTVTNSERRISRQRAFLPLPGEARPDWDIVADVARRMGFSGFAWAHPGAVFAEHAALSGFENGGTRDFDISFCDSIGLVGYEELAPFQWPRPRGATQGTARLFADGRFLTSDGTARIVPAAPPAARNGDGAFRLNTGRIRDQWHTMTRTGKAPRLMGQFAEPFCEIHPEDAQKCGIRPAELVEITNSRGTALLRALITDRQKPGTVFAPMHWSAPFSGRARINALVAGQTDPVSGQPALKGGSIGLKRFDAGWYGFAVSRRRPETDGLPYWAVAPVAGGWRMELAGKHTPDDWQAFAARLFGAAEAEWVGLHDAASGIARLAAFDDRRLAGALFVAPEPVALERGFVAAALELDHERASRLRLLAGRGGADRLDEGALVCACQNVGIRRIEAAIQQGALSVAAVGERCGAGTGCGSCRNDIARLIQTRAASA